MSNPLAIVFALLLVALPLLPGCQSETFRYKLTLTVMDNGVTYTASSVIEATQREEILCIYQTSSNCYPTFKRKGVAPVVMLPDGAVVFASLYGDTAPGDNGGQGADRLPWLVHVGKWDLGPGKKIIRLPRNPPPVELPLGDRTKKPPIYYVPPQTLGPPSAWLVGPSSIAKAANRDIKLISLTMAESREPLTEWLDPAPVWMASFRGGRNVPWRSISGPRIIRTITPTAIIPSFDWLLEYT